MVAGLTLATHRIRATKNSQARRERHLPRANFSSEARLAAGKLTVRSKTWQHAQTTLNFTSTNRWSLTTILPLFAIESKAKRTNIHAKIRQIPAFKKHSWPILADLGPASRRGRFCSTGLQNVADCKRGLDELAHTNKIAMFFVSVAQSLICLT